MNRNQTDTKTQPTNDELEKLWMEVIQRRELGANIRFAREVLARWGK